MAQLDDVEVVNRIITGDTPLRDGIPALVDRSSGVFVPAEGHHLDYKQRFDLGSDASVSELARDILGFSNTDGGLLIIGVTDDQVVVGHDAIDSRELRDALGPYLGTRVAFDADEIQVSAQGSSRRVILLHVRRSLNAYPNLLRKDIELRPGLVRKIKYIKGTLFYRQGNETFAESPFGDVDSRARDLRLAAPPPGHERPSYCRKTNQAYVFMPPLTTASSGAKQNLPI